MKKRLYVFLLVFNFLLIDLSLVSTGAEISSSPISALKAHIVPFTTISTDNPAGWTWIPGGKDSTSPPWRLVTENASWTARLGHRSVSLTDGSIILMGGEDGDFKMIRGGQRIMALHGRR